MALPALGLALKGMFSGPKDKGNQDPSQKATPKAPKVAGLKPNQKPAGESLKEDKVTKAQSTTPTRVTRKSTSSPLLKKTGIANVDGALQNVSKSLGSIKGTMASQAQFNKESDKKRADAARKKKRDKKEKESEKGPVGAVLSAISKVVPTKSILGRIFKFFTNIVLGGLVFYFMDNFEKIMGEVGKVVDLIKDFFKFFNKWVVTPVFNMVKAIAGPVNTAIKALAPENLPDFDKEKSDIEGLLGDFDLEIPIISDIIKGFNNFLSTGDPRISQEEFQEQVRDREDQPPAPQATPPTEVPQQNPFRNQPGGVYTGPSPQQPQQPGGQTSPRPSRPGSSGGSSGLSPNAKALLDTIAYAEGTSDSKGYVKWFGGRTDLDVTKMTIREVIAEQKRRLASGEATYNGYKSAAVGRYQIMEPEIFAKAAGISLDDLFSPANQDKLAIAGYMKKQAKLTDAEINGPITRELIAKIAPVWASLPNMQGRSEYNQPVKRYETLVKIYQQKLKEAQQTQPQSRSQATPPTQVPIRASFADQYQGLNDKNIPVTSAYGMRVHPISGKYKMHTGIDIAPPGPGYDVALKVPGVVTRVDNDARGYGLFIIITSSQTGMSYMFAHMDKIYLKNGEKYNGQPIGELGNTGGSTGIHLHYEVYKGGKDGPTVDPTPYVNQLMIGKKGSTPTGTRNVATVTQPGSRRRDTGIDRSASYDGSGIRTIIIPTASPPQPVPVGGASGMMSYSGGRGRIDNNKLNATNKLYKQ
tara:strand:- start:3900 stop:6161 length:2262 start_codon:yes stop_codon:yes gene_type:complete